MDVVKSRVEIGPAEPFAACVEHGDERRLALGRPEARTAGNDVCRRNLGEKIGESLCVPGCDAARV